MSSPQLCLEQEKSLRLTLTNAGVEHGDTADVTLIGVGTYTTEQGQRVNIAFCPAAVLRIEILQKGTEQDRMKEMPTTIRCSKHLQKRITRRAPGHGFMRLRLRVHSNGFLHLGGSVTRSEEAPANTSIQGASSYADFVAAGK